MAKGTNTEKASARSARPAADPGGPQLGGVASALAAPEPEYPRDNAIARAIVQVWPDHRTRPTVHEVLAFLALHDLGPGANVRTPGGAS